MGFLSRSLNVLSMTMTGKVLDRIDTPIMAGKGQISLRLKRKDDASETYVIVAMTNLSNETLYPLTATEFNDFADAVRTIRGELSTANERNLERKVPSAQSNGNIRFFKRALYGVGMILTGKVLDRINTQMMAGRGQMSLRLKQKNDASEPYVVISLFNNYSLYPLTATEFDEFADAVQTIRGGLLKAREEQKVPPNPCATFVN